MEELKTSYGIINYTGLNKKPDGKRSNHVYVDVYIGVAAASSTVIDDNYHHDVVFKGRPMSFANASGYLWIILPALYSPVVTMSSMEVSMTLDSITTIGTVTYKIWKSTNQYSGSFNISLL